MEYPGFTVTIPSTNNAAFGDTPEDRAHEVARILRAAAAEVERGYGRGTLRDFNGNRVGSFAFDQAPSATQGYDAANGAAGRANY